jgi:hypothetical protein
MELFFEPTNILHMHFISNNLQSFAALLQHGAITLSAQTTREHLRSHPIIDHAISLNRVQVEQEIPSGLQPADHLDQHGALLCPRDVEEGVEGQDRVEASLWVFQCCHIGLDERGLRDVLLNKGNLRCGDIDTGHIEAGSDQGLCGGHSGATSELEDLCLRWEQSEELLDVLCAGFGGARARPREVLVGDMIIAGLYQGFEVGGRLGGVAHDGLRDVLGEAVA